MHLPPFLHKIQKSFSSKEIMFFWYRHYKIMFFFWFLIVVGLGGFFWYQSLYRYEWDDARKKEFLEQHFKETAFKEKAFHNIVTHLKERERMRQESPRLSRDIFSGKPIE